MSADGRDKKPLKWLEVPIERLNKEAVPFHVDQLNRHRLNILKFQRNDNWELAHKEYLEATRAVQQLKALIFDIDGLRAQACVEDRPEFARRTQKSTDSIQKAIQAFAELDKPVPRLTSSGSPVEDWPCEGPLENAELPPLRVQLSLGDEERALAKQEATLHAYNRLQADFEDLNLIFRDFSKMADAQAEPVQLIEQNVEVAAIEVAEGNRILAAAVRTKAVTLPMIGALIGGAVAGPIGVLAGMKVAAIAGLSGGILGFTGGKMLRDKEIASVTEQLEDKTEEVEEGTEAETGGKALEVQPRTVVGFIS
ncbi:syntaxin-17 [Cloeon dipterum]|uniref:syntaxin-17 n=1 Tax=Cloeon dipterum TaxID=197152 RepID=UPI00322005CF